MSDVNVELVRQYFELNGFLVRVNRKYAVAKRESDEQGEIDLLVLNLNPRKIRPSRNFVLRNYHIPSLRKAAVIIKGWHSERFSPSVLNSSPELSAFTQDSTLKSAQEFFGSKSFKKILVLSRLPASAEMRKRSIGLLHKRAIDHIIEFGTVLGGIIDQVKVKKCYTESDLLQLIRLFKAYHLLREPQLKLFKNL